MRKLHQPGSTPGRANGSNSTFFNEVTMDGFLTILIWLGSGFAFSIGFLIGVIIAGSMLKKEKPVDEMSDRFTHLLNERNRIGREQADALKRIADRADQGRLNFQ
jgi:hypothetical protein